MNFWGHPNQKAYTNLSVLLQLWFEYNRIMIIGLKFGSITKKIPHFYEKCDIFWRKLKFFGHPIKEKFVIWAQMSYFSKNKIDYLFPGKIYR